MANGKVTIELDDGVKIELKNACLTYRINNNLKFVEIDGEILPVQYRSGPIEFSISGFLDGDMDEIVSFKQGPAL